jgi:SpoVK/Ycf46/Vps4 family AAA+-type ATPase
MAVLFVTNLIRSIDSAILRRAVAAYHFSRPNAEQRSALLQTILAEAGLDGRTIAELVTLTEPRRVPGFGDQTHRYTYSDITQRLIPSAVEVSVWAGEPLTLEILRQALTIVMPTPEMPQ